MTSKALPTALSCGFSLLLLATCLLQLPLLTVAAKCYQHMGVNAMGVTVVEHDEHEVVATNASDARISKARPPGTSIEALATSCTDLKGLESTILHGIESYSKHPEPQFLGVFGGIANGKSTATNEVMDRLGISNESFVIANKDALLMQVPAYLEVIKAEGVTRETTDAAFAACEKSAKGMQKPVLVKTVNQLSHLFVEWSAYQNLPAFSGQTEAWSQGLDKFRIAFAFVVVSDVDSVVAVEKERAARTGRSLPEALVRKVNTGTELYFLQAVHALSTNEVGLNRRFFVKRRCTAKSSGNLYEITEERMKEVMKTYNVPSNSEEAIEMMNKLVADPCKKVVQSDISAQSSSVRD